MRNTTLIATLGVLVLVAAAAVWFFLRPVNAVRVNAPNDSVSLTANDAPLAHNPANEDALPTAEAGPVHEAGPAASDAPGEGEWQVRGKIVLAPELARLVADPTIMNSEVCLMYLPVGAAAEDAFELYPSLENDLSFKRNFHDNELGQEGAVRVSNQRWQLLYSYANDMPPTLYEVDDLGIAAMTGIVIPTITGRVIDFGTVTIGVDMFFYHSVVLTGRLLHTTGRALEYAGGFYLAGECSQGEDTWQIEGSIYTQANGEFAAIMWFDHPERRELLQQYKWTIEPENDVEWVQLAGAGRRTVAAQWSGVVANFGDIKLPGALVEIVLKSDFTPSLDSQGRLKFGEWGEYEGNAVEVSFEGEGVYADARAYPQPYTTVTVMPEGRYIWHAWATGDGFYPSYDGVLLARDGQVHRLELDFRSLPAVTLEIKVSEGSLPQDIAVSWDMRKGEEFEQSGSFTYTDCKRVPVVEGFETHVQVAAPGFKPAVAVARTGMSRVEVLLEVDPTPPTQLTVVIPPFPATVDPGIAYARLHVYVGGWSQRSEDSTWGKEAVELTVRLGGAGRGEVYLLGGRDYGYPKGLLSGPIAFEIAVGETRRVELPAIADPPWAVPMDDARLQARTSGRPITLEATVRDVSGELRRRELADDGSFRSYDLPVEITDGVESYPLQLTPPEKAGGRGTLAFDFPHTIEVRFKRGGMPVDGFRVHAYREDVKPPELYMRCEADSIDGVAYLWIPRGRTLLVIGGMWQDYVDVVPGQLTQVEAASSKLELTLEVPPSDYDPDSMDLDAPGLWKLESASDEGWVGEVDGFSQSTILMVAAARYRAVPWNGGDPLEFEVSTDRSVQLPEIAPPKLGSIILKYDVTSLGSAWTDMEFYYALASDLKPNELWFDGKWAVPAVVPDGFKLGGLPLETDIVIWGRAYVSADDDYELMLKPTKIRITKDGQQVDAVIRRPLLLDDEWDNFEACWLTGIENFTPDFTTYALPGRQEVGFYKDGELVYREWITFPETSEEPYKIPETLRQELQTRQILEPPEEE